MFNRITRSLKALAWKVVCFGVLILPSALPFHIASADTLIAPLRTPWLYYPDWLGSLCSETEEQAVQKWIESRISGDPLHVCDAELAARMAWPTDPYAGPTIEGHMGCTLDGVYGYPPASWTSSSRKYKQYAQFTFKTFVAQSPSVCPNLTYAGNEGWNMVRQSFAYCPPGYKMEFVPGNLNLWVCRNVRPERDGVTAPQVCELPKTNLSFGTGQVKIRSEDVVGGSPEALSLVRTYSSVGHIPSMFGANWHTSYGKRIELNNPTNMTTVHAHRADGTVLHFNLSGTEWAETSRSPEVLQRTESGWKFYARNDSVETYDQSGKLISIRNTGDVQTNLTYSEISERLVSVHNDIGESLTFEYDAADRVSSVTDQAGRQWRYIYDGTSNLSEVIYPDGTPNDNSDNPRRRYIYNEQPFTENADLPHALTGILDETGVRVRTLQYYSDGRVRSVSEAGGVKSVSVQYYDSTETREINQGGSFTQYSVQNKDGVSLVTAIEGTVCSSCGI